jgi:hypothetical protein
MTATHITRRSAAGRRFAADVGLELSVWDALMLGRVSAIGPGLRARTSDTLPNPHQPVTSRKEVA